MRQMPNRDRKNNNIDGLCINEFFFFNCKSCLSNFQGSTASIRAYWTLAALTWHAELEEGYHLLSAMQWKQMKYFKPATAL